ncbi:MAG: hypothetical protein EBT85_04320 [Synechococcaceae bacterium WB5_2B_268]|nr:hypothetical protein [Synechococcaceae bacterium WB5_2B_268]
MHHLGQVAWLRAASNQIFQALLKLVVLLLQQGLLLLPGSWHSYLCNITYLLYSRTNKKQ